MIVFEPQIPWSLWAALAVAAGLSTVWYALLRDSGLGWLRRSLILVMMSITIAAPLCLLLNPTWVEPITPPSGKPLVTVLVDATQSMLTRDCDDQQNRWQAALESAVLLESTADATHDVSVLRFGQVTRRLLPDRDNELPDGSNTNLASVVRHAATVNRPQGHAIVLLSDGAHNVGSTMSVLAAADHAKAFSVPIYTSVVGGSIGSKNVSLSVRNPQLMTFPQRSVSVRVQVSGSGFAGRLVTVAVHQKQRQIAAKRVRINRDGPAEVTFQLRPDSAGLKRYVASVDVLDQEATSADNKASFQIQVIDEPIRVLLLEGKPYWDSKFLAANLAADASIELTTLIRIREDRLMRRTDLAQIDDQADESPDNAQWQIVSADDSDWHDPEKLRGYRVVVLGRSTEFFLQDESIERLRHWISYEGGALVCSRGKPQNEVQKRLSQLLPVRWYDGNEQRARGQLTSLGRSASLVDDETAGGDPITALPSLAIADRPKTTIGLPQVLVRSTLDESGESIPIVSHQPFGSGQTVVVEGSGMWRWAFLPPEKAEAEQVYADLWQGMMQWLISQSALLPGQELLLRSDRLSFVTGNDVTATVLVSDKQRQSVPDCILESDALELPKRRTPMLQQDQPGVFRVNFGALSPGHYVATLAKSETAVTIQTEFDVRDPWFERLEVDARPGLMRQLAERSGGKMLQPDEIGVVAEDFLEYLELSRPNRSRKTPLWDRSWVLVTILLAWTVCWMLRRISGLV